MKRFLYTILMVAIGTACTKSNIDDVVTNTQNTPDSITVCFEQDDESTRIQLNKALKTVWNSGDSVSVFYHSTTNEKWQYQGEDGETLGMLVPADDYDSEKSNNNIVITYPYSPDVKCNNNGKITTALPQTQTYRKDSYGIDGNILVANSQNNNLTLKNAVGWLRLHINGNGEIIDNIKVTANGGEPLAGNVEIDTSTASLTCTDKGDDIISEITLNCNNVSLSSNSSKTFYIAVPPQTYSQGMQVEVNCKDGSYMLFGTNKSFKIERNHIKPIDCGEYLKTGYDMEAGIHLGIIGFNAELYRFPLSPLSESTYHNHLSFIDQIEIADGTLLYYSVDEALASLSSIKKIENLSNVTMVTFTDGLDRGSLGKNPSYETSERYVEILRDEIKNTSVLGVPISSYTIGVKGPEVQDDQMFTKNLQYLASNPNGAPEDYAYEVKDMSEVNERFQSIANDLRSTTFSQSLSITTPCPEHKELIRITLDRVFSAEKSKMYIEGNFNIHNETLENVKYVGLKSTSTDIVQGVKDGIKFTFTFDGIVTDDGEPIQSETMFEWYYINSMNLWQANSEFDKDDSTIHQTIQNSAIIMLVLDYSVSLGSSLTQLKQAAKSFITTLCPSNIDDGDSTEPEDNYLTKPFDLALAARYNGDIYYLTPHEYDKFKANITPLGVVVLDENVNFYVELTDKYHNVSPRDTYSYSVFNNAPSTEIAEIIATRFDDINTALEVYGGVPLQEDQQYWTNDMYSSYTYFTSKGVATTNDSTYSAHIRNAYVIE